MRYVEVVRDGTQKANEKGNVTSSDDDIAMKRIMEVSDDMGNRHRWEKEKYSEQQGVQLDSINAAGRNAWNNFTTSIRAVGEVADKYVSTSIWKKAAEIFAIQLLY